jgi:hypothetical protein
MPREQTKIETALEETALENASAFFFVVDDPS